MLWYNDVTLPNPQYAVVDMLYLKWTSHSILGFAFDVILLIFFAGA